MFKVSSTFLSEFNTESADSQINKDTVKAFLHSLSLQHSWFEIGCPRRFYKSRKLVIPCVRPYKFWGIFGRGGGGVLKNLYFVFQRILALIK